VLFCKAQEFSLLQDSAVQPGNFPLLSWSVSFRLCPFEMTLRALQKHCRAETKNRWNQPKTPFGIRAATQGFHSSLRQVLSLQRIIQLCFEF